MCKGNGQEYNGDTMKTLDAQALKIKKENLHVEFEQVKERCLGHEAIIKEHQMHRMQCLEKMSELKGARKALDELEKDLSDSAS